MAMMPSFAQQEDSELLSLCDNTRCTSYAKHIQLPDKYTSFIFDFVNTYVGKAGADKSEEWWRQKGPFLSLDILNEHSNEFLVLFCSRFQIRDNHYYTYLGKYLLVADDPYFEKYVDDGQQLKIEYINSYYVDEPIYWCFEEKGDSLCVTDKNTPFEGAWWLMK